MPWQRKPFYSVTEFSYALAFLQEQMRDFQDDLIVSPIVPNLRQEGKLGWDVALPLKAGLFFFQFKNPEYIVRADARCVRRTEERDEFPTPCYRISLHKRRNYSQHNLLWNWAQRFPWTFYVSPQIPDDQSYQRYFFDHQITENSRFIPLNSCRNYPKQDPEPHYLVYGDDDRVRSCSESALEIRDSFGGRIRDLYGSEEHWQDLDISFLVDLFSQCCELSNRRRDFKIFKRKIEAQSIPDTREAEQKIMVELLSKSSEILSFKLGLIMMIVSKQEYYPDLRRGD